MAQLSFWERESFFVAQDIIIIGSGFTGLWSALRLKEKHPDYNITLLERGAIPTGASTRNAGFSCFGSPGELVADIAACGEDKMWQLVEMRYKGLLEIRKTFKDDLIGYDACGGYECFTNKSADWKDCLGQTAWLNKGLKAITGEENLFKAADEKIATFGFKGIHHLIENKLEAGLQPGKLVQALLQKVQSIGVKVLTGIEVKSYQAHSNGIEVQTIFAGAENQELNLTTNQLLLCTNAFTKQLMPHADIVHNRGQVLITNPIKGLKIKGTFHFDQGFYYFRNVGNRLLLGGARNEAFDAETTTVMETSTVIQNTLEHFIQQHLLPETAFAISDRWSGIMAMGSEKMPLIQEVSPGVFCCVRMSGMGVALAPWAAKKVAGLMA